MSPCLFVLSSSAAFVGWPSPCCPARCSCPRRGSDPSAWPGSHAAYDEPVPEQEKNKLRKKKKERKKKKNNNY